MGDNALCPSGPYFLLFIYFFDDYSKVAASWRPSASPCVSIFHFQNNLSERTRAALWCLFPRSVFVPVKILVKDRLCTCHVTLDRDRIRLFPSRRTAGSNRAVRSILDMHTLFKRPIVARSSNSMSATWSPLLSLTSWTLGKTLSWPRSVPLLLTMFGFSAAVNVEQSAERSFGLLRFPSSQR